MKKNSFDVQLFRGLGVLWLLIGFGLFVSNLISYIDLKENLVFLHAKVIKKEIVSITIEFDYQGKEFKKKIDTTSGNIEVGSTIPILLHKNSKIIFGFKQKDDFLLDEHLVTGFCGLISFLIGLLAVFKPEEIRTFLGLHW